MKKESYLAIAFIKSWIVGSGFFLCLHK